jgi:hypothetical protein
MVAAKVNSRRNQCEYRKERQYMVGTSLLWYTIVEVQKRLRAQIRPAALNPSMPSFHKKLPGDKTTGKK